ncbi:DUF4333 domain-containing protein [Nocardioidaceae bacterium SCSIO 66511]|nr:DUF4333 domain-containing protein [Nocardioidaceae bacterium SCSIO 66511]
MRERTRGRRAAEVSAALVLVVLLAGCGGIEVSTGSEISASDVAAKAEEALAPKVDAEPSITCDDGLSAEEGDSTTCVMRVGDDDTEYAVEATVSSVDGDDANLDFSSEDYRPGEGEGTIFADEVARQAEDALESKYGQRPEITCPDDLPGEVGATTRCVLGVAGDETKYGLTAEVTAMDGPKFSLDFSVDDEPLDQG